MKLQGFIFLNRVDFKELTKFVVLVLGGQHDHLVTIEMKPQFVLCFVVVKSRWSFLISNFDVFNWHLALVFLLIRKGKASIPDPTHFKNAYIFSIALAIYNFEKIWSFFTSQLLFWWWWRAYVPLIKVELFCQTVLTVLPRFWLNSDCRSEHCKSLFAGRTLVLMQAPRHQT